MTDIYSVKKLNKDINVKVPGSKSITNRALLIAAIGRGTSVIRNALDSDDSMHFLNCLKELGFKCDRNGDDITVEGCGGVIPGKKAEIYVGSAGTAARFLTAMLAFSDGEYVVRSSEQMAKRPMKDLLAALTKLGAEFRYMGDEYSFPFEVKGIGCADKVKGIGCAGSEKGTECVDKVKGIGSASGVGVDGECVSVSLNIDKSSQYLSAVLMTAPMLCGDIRIVLEGNRTAKSYVDITIRMMREFGVEVIKESEGEYFVKKSPSGGYLGREYDVEPDMSAACYFYAMAAVNGISATVKGVRSDMMQGDVKFLDVLRRMGCEVCDTVDGVMVSGKAVLKGIEIDMSDFSDQSMTLAAIAPFAAGDVNIMNVGHIRNQESDRLYAIETALTAMGVKTESRDDGILIHPSRPGGCNIDTFDDHRMAMAFAVTGTVYGNINICNPKCCGKTFPGFFDILDEITR